MFKKILYIGFFLCFISGLALVRPAGVRAGEGDIWELKTSSAGWGQRTALGAVVFNNKMWLMGGQTSNSCKNDVWYSADGVTWSQATNNAPWPARTYHGVTVFKNKLWVVGGTNVFTNVRMNDSWYSEDGIDWLKITDTPAPWAARDGHAVLVFNNKMWVLGGSYGGNDVWYTEDSVDWTKVTAAAGWSSRVLHKAVVFNNKMWVLGGSSAGARKNDVWYSSDGANWTQATANAAWSPRNSFGLVVYDNKMWVLGGLTSSGRVNDVWYSSDGINWTQATANANWSARNLLGALSFNNKMWVLGGAGEGVGAYLADVWATQYSTPAPATHTVTCNFIWPQQVVIDGTAYSCDVGAHRGFCNYTQAQQGISECCDWHEGAGYSNCAPIGPVVCTENWSCGEWAECLITSCNTWPNCPNQQTRACTDSNNCGTTTSKPTTTQSCSVTCTDSDGGQDFYTKGSTTGIDTWKQYKNGTETDYCSGNSVTEFYCYQPPSVEHPYINYSSMTCANGCADGACKKACTENWSCGAWSECLIKSCNTWPNCATEQTRTCSDSNNCGTTTNKPIIAQSCPITCTDSDNGQDYYVKGSTTGIDTWKQYKNATETDTCSADGKSVTEFYCYQPPSVQNPYINYGSMTCALGCEDGVCKKACTEDWRCGSWSSCANGKQTRDCSDAKNCGTTDGKPATSQSCGCAENWSCGTWSACVNSQQTRTCTDANNCGTSSSKPVVQQACQNQCQESWSCADWSACQNNQQTRVCTDVNNCGATNLKPAVVRNCETVCAEDWSCDAWTACVNGWETRVCKDLNSCGISSKKPETSQKCAQGPTTTNPVDLSIPTNKTPAGNGAPATPVNTTLPTELPPKLEVANPESKIFFGGVAAVNYLPGETMKFNYKYQNVTEKPVKVKIVRQMVNAKGKVVSSVQSYKTLPAGGALASDIKQTIATSLPAGVYTVKVKVYDAKNKIVDENSFPIELKKKFFVLNEMPIATEIGWDAKVWTRVKKNVKLPVNLKLRFSYTNNTGAKHVVKMVRELMDEAGKVIATKTSKWTMKVNEKAYSTFTQWLGDNLSVGNYTIRIQAHDWTTKELLAENSAGFTVELK